MWLVTGIIFLVLAPYNQNSTIRFHAFQSIFANVAWIILWIGIGVIERAMPFGVNFMIGLISGAVSLIGFLGWLFLMWKAYQGENLILPIVGPIAQQQAGRVKSVSPVRECRYRAGCGISRRNRVRIQRRIHPEY